MRRLLLILALVATTGCFPDLPDPSVVTNLRVLAIQADPAVALFNPFEPPVITVRALVVHPTNEDLTDVTHEWGFDFGDEDFEGKEALEALIPEGPYGTSIAIDLAPLFEQREGGWLPLLLPVTYSTADDELTRDAVKLVSFLLPDPEFGQGDDDDSAAEPEEPLEPTETQAYNENPTIVAISRGDERWTAEDLSTETALDVGEATTPDGLEWTVEYFDDEPNDDLDVEIYWNSGSAGLPPEPVDDDGFSFGGPGGGGPGSRFGGGAEEEDPDLGDGELLIEEGDGSMTFGWTPSGWDEAPTPRLWIVLRDAQGGQTWQEIRPR
ncbi:MAG: hypothetical protein GY898_17610 [Proteobacteria bacterium]|nr:hypothetical protein [Pseudomonadota bacterium]